MFSSFLDYLPFQIIYMCSKTNFQNRMIKESSSLFHLFLDLYHDLALFLRHLVLYQARNWSSWVNVRKVYYAAWVVVYLGYSETCVQDLCSNHSLLLWVIVIAGCARNVIYSRRSVLVRNHTDEVSFRYRPYSIILLPFNSSLSPGYFIEFIEVFNHGVEFFEIGANLQEIKHLISRKRHDGFAFWGYSAIDFHIEDQARLVTNLNPVWALDHLFKAIHGGLGLGDEILVGGLLRVHSIKLKQFLIFAFILE